jgi:DNA repair exonuclease SbcCD nuclease subunit
MKFLHTADWQIGMKAVALGDAGAHVREERLAAARRVVEVAKSHNVDFVLVAGDVFEDNGIDRVLVQKLADILSLFGGQVFVIPGNHDPFVPGSVWEHPSWKSASNVHVLLDEAPVEVHGSVLYPCPVREKHSGLNPTAWIPSERDERIRIGLAHGTVDGIRQDEPEYPIPRDAAQRAGLDFLALGHWHSYGAYPGPDGSTRMAYSGTHETTKFGERDSGYALIVEIVSPGVRPAITPVKTGRLDWVTVERELRESGDLTRVREYIESMANPGNALVEVSLSGLMMADERGELDHIEHILSSRFLWGKLDASRLRPSPQDEAWITNLPPGIIRDAAMRLRDTSGTSPEIAARALMELYVIAGEASK